MPFPPSPLTLIRPGNEFPQLFLAKKLFLCLSRFPVLSRGCVYVVSGHLEEKGRKKKQTAEFLYESICNM